MNRNVRPERKRFNQRRDGEKTTEVPECEGVESVRNEGDAKQAEEREAQEKEDGRMTGERSLETLFSGEGKRRLNFAT